MPDFMKILQQAQEMQGKFESLQAELAKETVTATSGGGMVTVVATLGYFLLGADGLHRTLHDAQHAVDAGLRIDRKEIRSFDETIDRAYRHAIGIFAFDARFSDNIGHFYSVFPTNCRRHSMRPAATVLLVASSITMKLPAVRFLR